MDETRFREAKQCEELPSENSLRQPCLKACRDKLAGIGIESSVPKAQAREYTACVKRCDALAPTPREACIQAITDRQLKASQRRQVRTVLIFAVPILILLLVLTVYLIRRARRL